MLSSLDPWGNILKRVDRRLQRGGFPLFTLCPKQCLVRGELLSLWAYRAPRLNPSLGEVNFWRGMSAFTSHPVSCCLDFPLRLNTSLGEVNFWRGDYPASQVRELYHFFLLEAMKYDKIGLYELCPSSFFSHCSRIN